MKNYSNLSFEERNIVLKINSIEDSFILYFIPTRDRHDIELYKELLTEWCLSYKLYKYHSDFELLTDFNIATCYYYFYRVVYNARKNILEFLGNSIQADKHFSICKLENDDSILGYSYVNEKTNETYISKFAYIKLNNKKYLEQRE